MLIKSKGVIASVLLASLIAACGGGANVKQNASQTPAPVPIEETLKLASAESSAGHTDKAIQLLKGAAKTYPADKKPWQQIAQLYFDNSLYADAIINAQEALQRDADDKLANSIVAVSGLRLSTKALADLAHSNNLTGNVRADAQALVNLMRENLGEKVLVPLPQSKTSNKVTSTSSDAANNAQQSSTSSSSNASNYSKKQPAMKSINKKTDTSDPFSNLK